MSETYNVNFLQLNCDNTKNILNRAKSTLILDDVPTAVEVPEAAVINIERLSKI